MSKIRLLKVLILLLIILLNTLSLSAQSIFHRHEVFPSDFRLANTFRLNANELISFGVKADTLKSDMEYFGGGTGFVAKLDLAAVPMVQKIGTLSLSYYLNAFEVQGNYMVCGKNSQDHFLTYLIDSNANILDSTDLLTEKGIAYGLIEQDYDSSSKFYIYNTDTAYNVNIYKVDESINLLDSITYHIPSNYQSSIMTYVQVNLMSIHNGNFLLIYKKSLFDYMEYYFRLDSQGNIQSIDSAFVFESTINHADVPQQNYSYNWGQSFGQPKQYVANYLDSTGKRINTLVLQIPDDAYVLYSSTYQSVYSLSRAEMFFAADVNRPSFRIDTNNFNPNNQVYFAKMDTLGNVFCDTLVSESGYTLDFNVVVPGYESDSAMYVLGRAYDGNSNSEVELIVIKVQLDCKPEL